MSKCWHFCRTVNKTGARLQTELMQQRKGPNCQTHERRYLFNTEPLALSARMWSVCNISRPDQPESWRGKNPKHSGTQHWWKAPLLDLQVYCSTCMSELHRHMRVFLLQAPAANNAEIYRDKRFVYRISSSSHTGCQLLRVMVFLLFFKIHTATQWETDMFNI